jgi:hypothetical protein
MNGLLQSQVSVRSLAILVLVLVGFWYVSIVGCISEIGTREWFWAAPLILLPPIIATFTTILYLTYLRLGKAQHRWFIAALLAAGSCFCISGLYLALIGVI